MVVPRGWVLCKTRFLSSGSSRHFSPGVERIGVKGRERGNAVSRSKGCKLLIIFDPLGHLNFSLLEGRERRKWIMGFQEFSN